MKRMMMWVVLSMAVLVFAVGALAQGLTPTEAPIDDLGAGIVSVLTDLILTKANVALMAGVWVLIQTARRLLPDTVFKSQAWVRVEPILGIVMCSIGVWVPGIRLVGSTVADTILLGIILGFVVGQSHKIGLQSVLGKDSRLEERESVAPVLSNPAVLSVVKPNAQANAGAGVQAGEPVPGGK